MREIKFRAWTGGEHEDIQFSKPGMEYDVLVGSQGYYIDDYGFIPTVKLMQYTGLKDKNGREIYEGDIVKADGISRNSVVTYVTEYASFKLGHRGADTQIDKYMGLWGDDCEVIGNTHEHPELLKAND